jgi:uncharacterized phage-associated protein
MVNQFNVNQVADFFLTKLDVEKGDSITPLKLQKLVYYAQAWHITIFGEPLFSEKIEAWAHGPVVKKLWERFKGLPKDKSIDRFNLPIESLTFPDNTLQLLEEVNTIYGEHTGSHLENLTHSELPWQNARKGLPIYEGSSNEITLDVMRDFYSKLKQALLIR